MQLPKGGYGVTNRTEHQWFPVAVLPGASTFTMSFTSGKFDSSLFAMSNAVKDAPEDDPDLGLEHAWRSNSTYVMSAGERHDVDPEAHTIELLNTPIAGSIYIAGMEATTTTTVASGKYKVNGKVLTFSGDDFGSEAGKKKFVDVVYDYTQAVTEAIITNKESAIGECVNASALAA